MAWFHQPRAQILRFYGLIMFWNEFRIHKASLLMKSGQSNLNLRSPGSYLVRSYLMTTVTKSSQRPCCPSYTKTQNYNWLMNWNPIIVFSISRHIRMCNFPSTLCARKYHPSEDEGGVIKCSSRFLCIQSHCINIKALRWAIYNIIMHTFRRVLISKNWKFAPWYVLLPLR